MNTISAASAAVIGARHARMARNGQDAAASWVGEGGGAIIVCDGCGGGASSEVGARLGVRWGIAAIAAGLRRGERPSALWPGVRAAMAAALAAVVDSLAAGETDDARAQIIHEHFLFTIVAAAVAGDEVSVWAIGDGGYVIGDRARVLGPFADNQPPYLAYDLLGAPAEAHVEACGARGGAVLVATDGAAELGLARLLDRDALAHPDGLRRRLAVLARGDEHIDWDARRVVRTPAALQDDGAVAALLWEAP
jgi:hypothetical protein